MKLDQKFYGRIFRFRNGSVVPDDQWVVFVAKDNAVPAMLRAYKDECIRLGAEKSHLDGIDALIARVDKWRAENPDLCKVPDTTAQELECECG